MPNPPKYRVVYRGKRRTIEKNFRTKKSALTFAKKQKEKKPLQGYYNHFRLPQIYEFQGLNSKWKDGTYRHADFGV